VSTVRIEKIFALVAQHSERQVRLFSVVVILLAGNYLANPLFLI